MTRFLKPLFLTFGLLLFIWALRSVDVTEVCSLVRKMGFGLLTIVMTYGLVAGFDALSWKYTFKPEEADTMHPLSIWRIRTIGETFNAITPLGTMGGEPVKAHLLKEKYGLTYKQGVASQVVARTTLTVSLILFMIPGIVFLFIDNGISDSFKISSLNRIGHLFHSYIFVFIVSDHWHFEPDGSWVQPNVSQ